jgi:hypothetical protein
MEAKMFELSVEEGFSELRIVERSKGVSWAIHLGKVSVAWLLKTMKALLLGGGLKKFVKSQRGNIAFIAQKMLKSSQSPSGVDRIQQW